MLAKTMIDAATASAPAAAALPSGAAGASSLAALLQDRMAQAATL